MSGGESHRLPLTLNRTFTGFYHVFVQNVFFAQLYLNVTQPFTVVV